jgi:monoterpene epsilon-lactone hydrolase
MNGSKIQTAEHTLNSLTFHYTQDDVPRTYHVIDSSDAPILKVMKDSLSKFKGSTQEPSEARIQYDQFIQLIAPAVGITYKQDKVGGVNGWWCLPQEIQQQRAVLYFHGGAYNLGSPFAYRNFVSHIALISKAAIFIPEYRLAPEHPYPAAVEDGQAVYNGLVKKGYQKISIVGDSAGGGLALAILAITTSYATKENNPKPISAVVMSPWTDLAFESKSLKFNANSDIMLTEAQLKLNANRYLSKNETKDPNVSPLYGNLEGLPPIQVHVGEAEILLDDAVRYACNAYKKGVTIDLHVWEGMPHVFPSNVNVLAAANKAMSEIRDFLLKY